MLYLTKTEQKAIKKLNTILNKGIGNNEQILYNLIINLILNSEYIEQFFINNNSLEYLVYYMEKDNKQLLNENKQYMEV